MKNKKMIICVITCMFLLSVLPGILGEHTANEDTFNADS